MWEEGRKGKGREGEQERRERKGSERAVVGQALGRLRERTNRNRKTQREGDRVEKGRQMEKEIDEGREQPGKRMEGHRVK